MRVSLSFTAFAFIAPIASAQAPVPKGEVPKFGLATATEKDGKLIIEVFELREIARMKTPTGNDVFIEHRHWLHLTTGTLGKDMRAFRPDGKPAEAKEVIAALAKPSGVAFYIGFVKGKQIQPDPFYLGLLREGSVALAFDRPELAPPEINGVRP